MPTCPNDATEMISTTPRIAESRTAVLVAAPGRCCPTCGYAE